jgi:hypothetical protein
MDLVEKLAAIEGIKATKAKYFRAVDTKDDQLWRSVYADEVYLDFRGCVTDPVTGWNFAPGTDEARMVRMASVPGGISETLAGIESVHHASVPEIEITGPTTGNAIWPMVDRLKFGEGAPYKELIGYGYYYDSYERVGDTWKVTSSRLVRTRLDFVPW